MESDVGFCFRCPKRELRKGKKYYMCIVQGCDVKIPKEFALKFLHRHADSMVYCYVCGEELCQMENCLMCIDGCGIKIMRTPSSDHPSDTDDSRNRNQPTCNARGEMDAGYIISLYEQTYTVC